MSEVGGDLLAYYAARAAEYEQVYDNEDPQYQSELLEIAADLQSITTDGFLQRCVRELLGITYPPTSHKTIRKRAGHA